jgi:membrane protease YdiL (CAAX protease family)
VGVVAAIGIPFLVSHTLPYQLGLSSHRLGANVFLGVFGVICLTPLVMGLHLIIIELMHKLELKPEEHPLSALGKSHPSVIEWILMTVSAAVAAPLIEELLARGLLQRWLATRRNGWAVAVCIALVMSLLPHLGRIEAALKAEINWRDVLNHLQTTAFVIVTIAPLLIVRRYVDSATVGAVYGSSIVFAAAHSAVWPSPVPLFFLAIGLGMLAYRTQSLVPSIVAHSLFNVFNLMLLVLLPEKI